MMPCFSYQEPEAIAKACSSLLRGRGEDSRTNKLQSMGGNLKSWSLLLSLGPCSRPSPSRLVLPTVGEKPHPTRSSGTFGGRYPVIASPSHERIYTMKTTLLLVLLALVAVSILLATQQQTPLPCSELPFLDQTSVYSSGASWSELVTAAHGATLH